MGVRAIVREVLSEGGSIVEENRVNPFREPTELVIHTLQHNCLEAKTREINLILSQLTS